MGERRVSLPVRAATALAVGCSLVVGCKGAKHATATTRSGGTSSSPSTTSAKPLPTSDPVARYNEQWNFLDTTRLKLRLDEQQLADQLSAAIASHSSDIATLDAKHQAVLRLISDLQERILKLEQTGPQSPTVSLIPNAPLG